MTRHVNFTHCLKHLEHGLDCYGQVHVDDDGRVVRAGRAAGRVLHDRAGHRGGRVEPGAVQRARRGDIDHVRYGLYRLRRFPTHPFADVIAACLWVGGDSAASHETAFAVHGISDAMPSVIHITVPRRFRGRQGGVVIHHADLPDADRTRVDAVPVTTIARTLHGVCSDQ